MTTRAELIAAVEAAIERYRETDSSEDYDAWKNAEQALLATDPNQQP